MKVKNGSRVEHVEGFSRKERKERKDLNHEIAFNKIDRIEK